MAIPVLILGDSGTGKSTSLMNLSPASSLCIQSINKRLPFRSNDWGAQTKSIIVTDDYNKIHKALNASALWGKDVIIIDDANYLMQNAEMRRCEETGYKKYTEFAKSFWSLIDHCTKLPTDQRIYIMMHTQTNAEGIMTPKTSGKLLDEKIVIAGLFTIVLKCNALDGRHFFTTRTSGTDPVKTPIDMFTEHEINNDLSLIDNKICQYYGIEKINPEK